MKKAALLVSLLLLASLFAPALITVLAAPANQTTPSADYVNTSPPTNSTETHGDDFEHPTGLKEETKQGLEWMSRVFPVASNIRINGLALERINNERTADGLKPLDGSQVSVAPFGQEAELPGSAPAPRLRSRSILNVGDVLPGGVDNNQSTAFPPIGDQGSLGSCPAFVTTYYQLTYEQNMLRARVANGGDYSVIFSPKWTYNLINGGVDGGGTLHDAYSVLLNQGAPTWSEFPYDNNYRGWPLDKTVWRNAINNRLTGAGWGSISDADPSSLITKLKTQLANGHVLVAATYIYSWSFSTVANDPSTAEDDAYVGQSIARYRLSTRSGPHAVTIVGYNDDLWTDLNANGVVDAGESGAFKVANSWGAAWRNGGFVWVSYDALRGVSEAPPTASWPPAGRDADGIFSMQAGAAQEAYFLVAQLYQPKLVAEITLRSSDRSQTNVSLRMDGVASTETGGAYNATLLSGIGGNLAFDGGADPVDMTFIFDYTRFAPTVGESYRWYTRVDDLARGAATTVEGFRLYEVTGGGDVAVGTSASPPVTLDADTSYVWVDYRFGSLDTAPVARLSTTLVGSPSTIGFDASASADPDGSIASYSWDFGDGSTAEGATATHGFAGGGTYRVWLTVTDDDGSEGTATTVIETGSTHVSLSKPSGTVGTRVRVTGSIATYNGQYTLWLDRNGDDSFTSGEAVANGAASGYSVDLKATIPDAYGGGRAVRLTDSSNHLNDTLVFTVQTGYSLSVDSVEGYEGGPFTLNATVTGAPRAYDGVLDLRIRVVYSITEILSQQYADLGQIGFGRFTRVLAIGPESTLVVNHGYYFAYLDWDIDGAFPPSQSDAAGCWFYVTLMNRWSYQRTEVVRVRAFAGVGSPDVHYQLADSTGFVVADSGPLTVAVNGFAPEYTFPTAKDTQLGGWYVAVLRGASALRFNAFTVKRADLGVAFVPGTLTHGGAPFTVHNEEAKPGEVVSVQFTATYPSGAFATNIDVLTPPTIGVYRDDAVVGSVSLTSHDYDPASHQWTVEWVVPVDSNPGGAYSLRVAASSVTDVNGNTGPVVGVSTASMSVFGVASGGRSWMVVRGEDDGVWVRRYYTGNTSWSGWRRLPGSTLDEPAAAELGGVLHLVVRGVTPENSLYHGMIDQSGVFTGWTLMDGASPSAPTLTSNGTALGLSVLGESYNIIWYRLYRGGAWGGWRFLPTGATPDAPSIAFAGGDLHFVVRGMDGASIWHSVVRADGSFEGWTLLDGATGSRPTLAWDEVAGTIYLLVQGMDDGIYYRGYSVAGGTWGAWASLPGATLDSPAASVNLGGLFVAVRGSDGRCIWWGAFDSGVFAGWNLTEGWTPSAPTLS